jgi:hypothetical protein
MAKKVPVVVMVDPELGLEIKPFAAELSKAQKINPAEGDDVADNTFTATYTYKDGKHDGDATID